MTVVPLMNRYRLIMSSGGESKEDMTQHKGARKVTLRPCNKVKKKKKVVIRK